MLPCCQKGFSPLLTTLLHPVAPALQGVRDRLSSLPLPPALLAQVPPALREGLTEALAYSVAAQGKLVRPALALLAFEVLAPQHPQLTLHAAQEVATIAELIHLATLLHDDVLDEAALRRGRPTTSARFGNHLAILAGDWLLAHASQRMAALNCVGVVEAFAEALAQLCEGEALQSQLAYQVEATTWAAYLQKTHGKTVSLYVATLKALGAVGQVPSATMAPLLAYGEAFGYAFQLVDDELDYVAEAATLGKPVLQDLRLGLLNAPILLAVQHAPAAAASQVLEAIAALWATLNEAERLDPSPLEEEASQAAWHAACQPLLALLHQAQAFEHLSQCLATYVAQGVQALEASFEPSPAREALVGLLRYNTLRSV